MHGLSRAILNRPSIFLNLNLVSFQMLIAFPQTFFGTQKILTMALLNRTLRVSLPHITHFPIIALSYFVAGEKLSRLHQYMPAEIEAVSVLAHFVSGC